LTVTVHPQDIPTLTQTAKGNLGASFSDRLFLMGRYRGSVCGPRPGTAALQEVPRPSEPSSRAALARTCVPALRSLHRCWVSLHRRLPPGAFAPVARASALDLLRTSSPQLLVLRPDRLIRRRLSPSFPARHIQNSSTDSSRYCSGPWPPRLVTVSQQFPI